jgi:hypothetical protein
MIESFKDLVTQEFRNVGRFCDQDWELAIKPTQEKFTLINKDLKVYVHKDALQSEIVCVTFKTRAGHVCTEKVQKNDSRNILDVMCDVIRMR